MHQLHVNFPYRGLIVNGSTTAIGSEAGPILALQMGVMLFHHLYEPNQEFLRLFALLVLVKFLHHYGSIAF